jgi:predicted dehydrogenase
MRFAAIGLDHRHIYHLVEELLRAGATCVGYDPETSDPRVLSGFQERFPGLAPRSRGELLEDPTVPFICCAAVPSDRARIAVAVMRNGKDVMVDKPGIISRADLAEVKTVVRETGRIFSICFSERFVVPSTEVAGKLIEDGAIGRVIQTIGLGLIVSTRASDPAGSSIREVTGVYWPTSPLTRSINFCTSLTRRRPRSSSVQCRISVARQMQHSRISVR